MVNGDIARSDNHPTWRVVVDRILEDMRLLAETAIPVVEMPDAAGAVRAVEVKLAAIRQGWNAEQLAAASDPESELGPSTFPPERGAHGTRQPQVVGTEFRTVTTRTAKRSYNTAAILCGIARGLSQPGAGVGPIEALTWAVKERLAKVEWRWQELQRVAREYGLPLRVVQGVVADDGDTEGPWVGELWKTRTEQEALRGE